MTVDGDTASILPNLGGGLPALPGAPRLPGGPAVPGAPRRPGVPTLPGVPQAPGLPLPTLPGTVAAGDGSLAAILFGGFQ